MPLVVLISLVVYQRRLVQRLTISDTCWASTPRTTRRHASKRIHARTHTRTPHAHACMHARTHARTHTCTHACTHAQTHMDTLIRPHWRAADMADSRCREALHRCIGFWSQYFRCHRRRYTEMSELALWKHARYMCMSPKSLRANALACTLKRWPFQAPPPPRALCISCSGGGR